MNPDELSPATSQLIQALLRPDEHTAPTSIDDESLIRFATGLSPTREVAKLVSSMATSGDLRTRFITLRKELGLEAKSAFVPERSPLKSVVYAALEAYVDQGRRSSRELKGHVSTALKAISKAALEASITPIPAIARGEDGSPQIEGHLPPGLALTLNVAVAENGDLVGSATFNEVLAGSLQGIIGRVMVLELLDPAGGAIPIAAGKVTESNWQIRVEDFSALSGLEPGPLDAGLFRLRAGNREASLDFRGVLIAQADTQDWKGPVPFLLTEAPRVQSGELLVTLQLESSYRGQHHLHWLELWLQVGTLEQLLGSWRLADWIEDTVTLRTQVPEAQDGEFSWASVIKARVVEESDVRS